MVGLPPETVASAVGVLIYTIICLLCDLALIWLLWVHHERLGYVALIAYFVQLCVISSIVQQIYHYAYYEDIMWAQLDYIKAHYPSAEVIFKGGNFGFMLVLSNIRFFCYIIESTYLLTYTLHITLSIYGVWTSHRRAERIYVVLSKTIPLLLTALSVGLEYTPAVQGSWTAYMFVANAQAVASCTFSIVLIAMILWKYVENKIAWKRIDSGPAWMSKRRGNRTSSSTTASAQTLQARDHVAHSNLDNWLVLRLSIAIILISGFILATVLTHIPQPTDMARKVETNEPDLSAASAKSSIIGYIYGVSPGIAIPLVFGLRRPFLRTMHEKFVPKRWQKQQLRQSGTWEVGAATRNSQPSSVQNVYELSPGKDRPVMTDVGDARTRAGSSGSLASRSPLLSRTVEE